MIIVNNGKIKTIKKDKEDADKDAIISSLMLENGELKQRVEDMELIVSELMGGAM